MDIWLKKELERLVNDMNEDARDTENFEKKSLEFYRKYIQRCASRLDKIIKDFT